MVNAKAWVAAFIFKLKLKSLALAAKLRRNLEPISLIHHSTKLVCTTTAQ